MMMFTLEAYEAQMELTRSIERHRIARLLRQAAEDHPKWETHDLLQLLAQEVEDHAGKTN